MNRASALQMLMAVEFAILVLLCARFKRRPFIPYELRGHYRRPSVHPMQPIGG
jgi:hypothetical protein